MGNILDEFAREETMELHSAERRSQESDIVHLFRKKEKIHALLIMDHMIGRKKYVPVLDDISGSTLLSRRKQHSDISQSTTIIEVDLLTFKKRSLRKKKLRRLQQASSKRCHDLMQQSTYMLEELHSPTMVGEMMDFGTSHSSWKSNC